MIENTVFYLGLTQVELQTLRCRFPISFHFHPIPADQLNDTEKMKTIVTNSWCLFINPKELKSGQLDQLIRVYEYAKQHTHTAMLLFTNPFTPKQKESVDAKVLQHVNLLARFDTILQDVLNIIHKATFPCWDGMARMKNHAFHDGWYLLDMETSGTDPLESDVISLSVSYMTNYKIQSTETLYIRQPHPISKKIETVTGITNQMLEHGVTKEQAIEYLNNLSSPIIIESSKFYLPFLKALYHSCGQKFNLPRVSIDGLAAITFDYTIFKRPYDILPSIKQRKYERTQVEDPYLAKLYDLTLLVFENLQERYGVQSAEDFCSLYDAVISCGE